MRIVLSILLGLFVLLPCFGCGASKLATMQTNRDAVPGYEIVIRLFENGNATDKVIDIFSKNGLMITKVQQIYLSAEKQELRISIRGGNSKRLNETEYQLRSIMYVESVSIHRL